MKQILPFFVIAVFIFSASSAQDTLPKRYFDDRFELKPDQDSLTAAYYGICEPAERHIIATIYDHRQIKIATITYSNKELTVRDGEMAGYYDSGAVQFTVNYSGNSLNGQWMTFYPDGQHCDSGKFKNDLPDGEWRSWYPNGQVRLAVEFSARKFAEVQEELQRFAKHKSTGIQSTSQVRFGNAAPFQGEHIYKLMQQALQPPEIIGNSLRLCLKTKVDHNSITGFTFDVDYAPPFTQCLMQGEYKSYFPDGTLREYGFYDSGLRVGQWEEWNDEEGIKSIGVYKKGVRTGEWRHYGKFDRLLTVHRYP
jgi:antitoxin component YwqK of YwqJK toxin-antitoxin module